MLFGRTKRGGDNTRIEASANTNPVNFDVIRSASALTIEWRSMACPSVQTGGSRKKSPSNSSARHRRKAWPIAQRAEHVGPSRYSQVDALHDAKRVLMTQIWRLLSDFRRVFVIYRHCHFIVLIFPFPGRAARETGRGKSHRPFQQRCDGALFRRCAKSREGFYSLAMSAMDGIG